MKKQTGTRIAIIAAVVLICGAAAYFLGRPMVSFLSDPEQVRAWVEQNGILSRLAFVGMMIAQIVVAVLPGEPLEICAGYAFGALEGTLLCLAGALLGTLIVFVFTKRYGTRLAHKFFSEEKLNSVGFLKDAQKLHMLTFLLFFIPGTPKDILTYALGITAMRLPACLAITSIARIPSVVTSTIGGDALGTSNILFAVIVFAATAVISGLGILVYRRITMKKAVAEVKLDA